MKIINKKYAFHTKMIIYINLLVIVIILSLSFIFYYNFENIGLNLQYKSNLNILSGISYSADYFNDSAKNMMAYLISDVNNILPLRYSKSEDIYEAINRMKGISVLVDQSPYVQSVYIYNGYLKKFYSTTWENTNSADEFFDQDIAGLIKENKIPHKNKISPVLRKVPLNNYQSPETYYMYVLSYIVCDYFGDSDRDEMQSAIIVNMREDYLAGLIDKLNAKSALGNSETLIISGDGTIISRPDKADSYGAAEEESFIKKILDEKEKSGYFIDDINGKKALVSFALTDNLDWKFVNIMPYSMVTAKIDKMKRVTYIICLIILVLGFPVSYFVAHFLYFPIRSMMGNVERLTKTSFGTAYHNEVDYITGAFNDTLKKAEALYSVKLENDIIHKRNFIQKLLENDDTGREFIESTLQEYKMDLSMDDSFMACILAIDRYSEFASVNNAGDRNLLRFALCNVIGEIASKYYKNQCVDLGESFICLLIEVGQEDITASYSKVSEILSDAQGWCEQNLTFSLSAAMGNVVGSLPEISGSYKLALDLIKYRLIFGHKCVVTPDLLIDLDTDSFEHPVALEQELSNHISAGDREESVKCYRKIIAYISRYSYNTITSYLLYLSYQIYRISYELEAKGYERNETDCNSFIKSIISLETLQEIDVKFVDLIKLIADTVGEKKFSRKNALLDKIIDIVEKEYRDKSLCQEEVASRLKISRDYLGKIFRKAYSKSFAEYLTEIRLQKAVELLKEGKNATEILESIGWENKNYFYTTFKQKYGMTTMEYKDSLRL